MRGFFRSVLAPVGWLLASGRAFALEEPCYGLTQEHRVAGENLWLTWDGDALPAARAESFVNAADATWRTLRDDLGWMEPPGPMAATVSPLVSGGITITIACDGEQVPKITVDDDAVASDVTLIHELAHAFQYPYFEGSGPSLTAWAWWMEASATWMQGTLRPRAPDHKSTLDAWRADQAVALHQDVSALAGDDALHMYGSAWLAWTIATDAGGPEAVRGTWACGALREPGRIWFPDLVAELGGDFDALWLRTLAHAAVGDLPLEGPVGPWLRTAGEPGAVRDLPANGDATAAALGWTSVAVNAEVKDGRSVTATLTPDDDARWIAALVIERDGAIAAVHVAEPDGGALTARVTPDDGDRLFWVASPTDDDDGAHTARWSVSAGPAAAASPELGPLAPLVCEADPAWNPADNADEAGCGCTSGTSGLWAGVLPAFALARRRRPRA